MLRRSSAKTSRRNAEWIKQHLRIKAFYGTSQNAVRTQIWSAVAVYLLVAILKSGCIWIRASTPCYRF